MATAVYTGSFNPFTDGHMNVVKRAAALFDVLYVAVLINPEKPQDISVEERARVLGGKVKGIDNAVAASYNGLAADFVKEVKADYIVRGIRDAADYLYEREMAQINYTQGGVRTLYLLAEEQLKQVSSTNVKTQTV